jgi:3-hydroxy-9,10-secoandrosta-1,3,5(10)-triene-9,17-dione monooxygenase reductase component
MSTTPIPPEAFRRVMGRWATGVSVVTAREGDVDAGLTVNALLSVSLTPPSLVISLTRDVDTLPLIERSGWFAVSLLAADQRPLSERFARTDPPAAKFRDVAVHRAPHGLAVIDGALAAVECRVVTRTPTYDHVLLVGEVTYEELGRDALPLLFFRSSYGEADESDRVRLPPGRS